MRYFYFDVDNLPEVLDNKLYESTLKDIKSQSMSYPQIAERVRKQKLRVQFLGVDKQGFINFSCTSGTTPGLLHYVKIELLDLPEAVKEQGRMKDRDIINLALFGDIKVYCSCEAFRYYFQYISYIKGYGIHKEVRYPKVRNPRLKGSVCKHTLAVLNALPMYISSLVKAYRQRRIL